MNSSLHSLCQNKSNDTEHIRVFNAQFGMGEKLEASIIWLIIETLGNGLLYQLDSWYYNNPYKTVVDHLQWQTLTVIMMRNMIPGTIFYLRYSFSCRYP